MAFDTVLTRRTALGWIGAAFALPAVARPAPQVMLAREAPADLDPAGWLVSEKFDGARAVWDGHALRFRSGLPVHAPAWFVERLPATPLDGELWLGRGRFEQLAAVVRKHEPVDAEWRMLRYQVFDLPGAPQPFAERARRIVEIARQCQWPQLLAVDQAPVADTLALARRFTEVLREGGEGLVLHRADSAWRPGRSDDLLKLKPESDAEAVVTGHVAGHGKYEGRVGALRVRSDDGIEFLIGSGLSDAERSQPPALGSVVTYTYRGRTAAGVPRFATFLRRREL